MNAFMNSNLSVLCTLTQQLNHSSNRGLKPPELFPSPFQILPRNRENPTAHTGHPGWANFENWYFSMSEDGFSFFEIQTPPRKFDLPQTKRSPENNPPCLLIFQTQNNQPFSPHHLRGSELC